ncbi:MAG TPA: hypothetical protein VNA21_15855, partial [Steroidobacteraceae bacterium]|nr:hypothetical protein [Steroidobacteraceae bacterium]
VTDIPARRISERLTDAEVRDAIDFFQGTTGRKFVRRSELALTRGLSAKSEALSASEVATMSTFKKGSAGQKLLSESVGTNAAAMSDALARIDPELQDCALNRQIRTERRPPPGYCESRAVASPDHACLAVSVTKEKSAARHAAEVRISCRRNGDVLQTIVEHPRPQMPIALRWEEPRQLVILLDDPDTRMISSTRSETAAQRYRFASRQARDPAPLQCLPRNRGAMSLPVPTAIAAWRTYRSDDVCQMTSRIPADSVPGISGHVLLNFSQHKTPALPFATTSLVLAVQIYGTDEPLHLEYEEERLLLIEGGNQQMHILEGRGAESVFNALRSKPLRIHLQPSVGEPYEIPLSQQDFVFAAQDFETCLNTIGVKN